MIKSRKVAIQGGGGSNHEITAHAYFENDNVETIECNTFDDLFAVVKNDSSIFGVVAIENTLVGSILQNYTLLKDSGLRIIGEYKLRIKHQLMALEGQKVEDLTEIHSHPMALAQCSEFLHKYPHIKLITRDDTALSAKWIKDNNIKGVAAIAPQRAADIHKLEVIANDIETNKRNFTRFLVVCHDENPELEQLSIPKEKASMVFALPHAEGSLSHILSVLAFYKMNLSKIQSLPIVGQEWEYMFYVDVVFDDYNRYQQALSAIRPLTNNLRTFGEYAVGKNSFGGEIK